MKQHTRKKYPFHRRANGGGLWTPASLSLHVCEIHKRAQLQCGNHSTVVNTEIISRWNWEKRTPIPTCFVPSFNWTISSRHDEFPLLERTRCQRLIVNCKPRYISFCFTLKKVLTSDRTRNAHAPTSPRSIGFCALWDCISSSSSYFRKFRLRKNDLLIFDNAKKEITWQETVL